LRNNSSRTRKYNEEGPEGAKEEVYARQPYEGMTGSDDDPLIPLSVLGKAMACWISLTLPAREVFNLRMQNRSLARIANLLGCKKQSVAGVLKRALKENPVMASLAAGGQEHRKGRKRKIIHQQPGL
jgi:DNA-binding CsgD family transcriptional regulator